jgi:hypothetical protein
MDGFRQIMTLGMNADGILVSLIQSMRICISDNVPPQGVISRFFQISQSEGIIDIWLSTKVQVKSTVSQSLQFSLAYNLSQAIPRRELCPRYGFSDRICTLKMPCELAKILVFVASVRTVQRYSVPMPLKSHRVPAMSM